VIFNSLHYLFFLPLVTLLYYLLPVRSRWILLLIASYYFYMVWEPIYIVLILISTLVDYYCGIKMGELHTKKERRPFMLISLMTGLTMLGTFKYYDFFADSTNKLLAAMNMEYMLPIAHLILPLGISFYTFQTLSYTFDVYKGKSAPEKKLGIFALYVMFFPQLVAGPIERASHLISQFHFDYKFDREKMTSGLRLILLGLFKKVVIADQLGIMVASVFNHPDGAHSVSIYIACLLFAQQVYCDFSGYTDIARGSARLLGIELMENFQLPFFSRSINVMWTKWHISLMSWFRDYIMFPLIRKGWSWPAVFGLIFLVSGIWHGANWTFVVWGLYNGIFVIYSKSTEKFREGIFDKLGIHKNNLIRQWFQFFMVFHIFAFGSVFFRARTLSDSWTFIKGLFTDVGGTISLIIHNPGNVRQDILYLGKDSISFYLIIGFVIMLELFQWQLRKNSLDKFMNGLQIVPRFTIYLVAVISIILMSNISETPFIYFQF